MNYRAPSSARAAGVLILGLIVAPGRNASAQLAGIAGFGAAVPARVGPLVFEAGATANRIGSSVAPRTTLDVASSVSVLAGDGGFWLGASSFSAREVDSLPLRPLLSAGVWREFPRVTLSIGAQSHIARLGGRGPRTVTTQVPDHLVPVPIDTGGTASVMTYTTIVRVDSGVPSQLEAWSDLEAGASWWVGHFRLGAIVGARPSVGKNDMAVWGRISGETQLNSRLALSAGVGAQPAQLAIGVPSSRFARIGLNVATWHRGEASERPKAPAAAFAVRRVDASRYRIEYRVAGAHRVEVSGDFNNWEPVELTETAPGLWQSTVSVTPGTYRMNVRVDDGRWNAPPGTVEIADDFNGTVGIVVVR